MADELAATKRRAGDDDARGDIQKVVPIFRAKEGPIRADFNLFQVARWVWAKPLVSLRGGSSKQFAEAVNRFSDNADMMRVLCAAHAFSTSLGDLLHAGRDDCSALVVRGYDEVDDPEENDETRFYCGHAEFVRAEGWSLMCRPSRGSRMSTGYS